MQSTVKPKIAKAITDKIFLITAEEKYRARPWPLNLKSRNWKQSQTRVNRFYDDFKRHHLIICLSP